MKQPVAQLFCIICVLSIVAVSLVAEDVVVTGEYRPELKPFDDLMFSFIQRHNIPGGSLAVAKDGRLVYARGFGFAQNDAQNKQPVQPDSLFRIASISKPITAIAILQLIEQGQLRGDDKAASILNLTGPADARFKDITVLQLLQHMGGWDSALSGDPMFRSVAIAKEFGSNPPASAGQIVEYMKTQRLDFDPGTRYAYSNFGYCMLGRIIEKKSGLAYDEYVKSKVLTPLGISAMCLGRTEAGLRHEKEVCYTDKNGKAASVFAASLGQPVPLPYGAWCLESMDSHGGWLSSSSDLVRFACAFNQPEHCAVLNAKSVALMFSRPDDAAGTQPSGKGNGRPNPVYYGCGWAVRAVDDTHLNTWHAGSLDGTSSLLVRRWDGLTWAVLFNTRLGHGKDLNELIDPLLHKAADAVKEWPAVNLFEK